MYVISTDMHDYDYDIKIMCIYITAQSSCLVIQLILTYVCT